MKEQKIDIRRMAQERGGTSSSRSCHLRSERGVVLVMVIVLSAVVLAVMTALIYMITIGTQVSGLQKRYKTALEAGVGGGDVFYQLVALRGDPVDTDAFKANLNSFNLNSDITTTAGCQGELSSGATYTGLTAKLLTPSTSWTNCDRSIAITSTNPATYDMKMELGTTTKYSVYAKIVATTEGNTGGNGDLMDTPVVDSGSKSAIPVMARPYIYAIETLSENNARSDERAKLSIVYQY